MTGRAFQVAAICLAMSALCLAAGAQSPIENPSFEENLFGWETYGYTAAPIGMPAPPETGCIGPPPCRFDVLIPDSTPDGVNVCGMQAWGYTANGGVYQQFFWPGGPATIAVTARAYSEKYDYTPFDNGCRVRMGLVNYSTSSREDVTAWVTFPWSDAWHTRTVSVPGPGYHTLFVESYQPNSLAIMSTLWDKVVFSELPPVIRLSGPAVDFPDPQHPDTTVRIQWTTDVPSSTRVDYGPDAGYGQLVENPALVTEHVVVLTNLQPSSEYHFRARSAAPGYVDWVSDDLSFRTPIQFANIATRISPDGGSVIVSWNTDRPTTTQVEFGTSAAYGSQTPEDTNLSTSHEVWLSGLDEDTEYHFRLWARNRPYYTDAASPDLTFRTLPAVGASLRNGGFEGQHGGVHSLYPWVQYETLVQSTGYHPIDGLVGPIPQGGAEHWFADIRAFEGSYFVGAAANSGYKNGGVFQRVSFPAGKFCTLSARFATYRVGGTQEDTRVRLGIDPYGGVNPEGLNVKWWSGFSYTNDNQWHPASITTKSGPNGVVTVFLDIRQQWPLQWHVVAIDAAAFGAPEPKTIGQLRSGTGGLSAVLDDKVVTYVDPRTHIYQGKGYTKAYIQEEDRSAGVAVLFNNDMQAGRGLPLAGNRVSVLGSLSVRDGEAMLTADDWIVDTAMYPLPRPVAMSQRALGGVAANQPPLFSSSGACSVGLRVRVFGRVNWVDAEGMPGYDVEGYLDDGTGRMDDSGVAGTNFFLAGKWDKGVRAGDYVWITGVLTVRYVDPDGWPNGDEYYTYTVANVDPEEWDVVASVAP